MSLLTKILLILTILLAGNHTVYASLEMVQLFERLSSIEGVIVRQPSLTFMMCSDCLRFRGITRNGKKGYFLPRDPIDKKSETLEQTSGKSSAQTRSKIVQKRGSVEFEPLLFETSKESLSSSEMKKFNDLVQNANYRMKREFPDSDVSFAVYGYTDAEGSNSSNESLSNRRAEHVALLLDSYGFKIDSIIGKGECCLVSGDKKLNRRVVVKLIARKY